MAEAKEGPDVEKALSFFRIFDLAFFLPGFVIYRFRELPAELVTKETGEGTAGAVLQIVTLIAACYVLGLLTHAASRALKFITGSSIEKWYPKLVEGQTPSWTANAGARLKGDLRGYFWYTRAVCINLAIALGVVAIGKPCGVALGLGAAALALAILHFDFDRALKGI